jgi:hypothetical protein
MKLYVTARGVALLLSSVALAIVLVLIGVLLGHPSGLDEIRNFGSAFAPWATLATVVVAVIGWFVNACMKEASDRRLARKAHRREVKKARKMRNRERRTIRSDIRSWFRYAISVLDEVTRPGALPQSSLLQLMVTQFDERFGHTDVSAAFSDDELDILQDFIFSARFALNIGLADKGSAVSSKRLHSVVVEALVRAEKIATTVFDDGPLTKRAADCRIRLKLGWTVQCAVFNNYYFVIVLHRIGLSLGKVNHPISGARMSVVIGPISQFLW